MDLILWRHAEAVDFRAGEADLERALTATGERQAARMADWLTRQVAPTTRVLASPARRTQQTAKALGRRFETASELVPGGTVEALLSVARWPDSPDPVLVIGHQPTLGMAASYLLNGTAAAWTLRKGGVLWLRRRKRGADLQVVLHAALTPDMV